jgi:hypothetical protein
MLRASAKAAGQPVDAVNALNGEEVRESVPHGPLLVGLVDAVLRDDPDAAEGARARLAHAAGPAAVGDAVAVIANFEMMTRVADSTGARLPPERLGSTQSERQRLGVDGFSSAR